MTFLQINPQLIEADYEGEKLILTHKKVIWWARERTIILADLHLGKSGFFRQNGIPIPSTVQAGDLQQLEEVIEQWNPLQILIVGDMFHHNHNADVEYFASWKKKYTQLSFTLVPGNHDKLLPIQYNHLGISLTSQIHTCIPFQFTHEWLPHEKYAGLCLAGHLHPAVTLKGIARQSITSPCFAITHNSIILPAFSQFTGLCSIPVYPIEKNIVVTKNSIFQLPIKPN